MNLSLNLLKKITLLYLVLPIIIFLAFWAKPAIAILSILGLVAILKIKFKEISAIQKKIKLSPDYIAIILLICLFWCYSSGIGGYFWQTMPDWPFRNAMYRDLTFFSWPVIYSDTTAFVYYFGHCLVPAFLTKVVVSIFNTNYSMSWEIANFLLFIWAYIGIVLVALNLLYITKSTKTKIIVTLLFLLLFTGLDVFIGTRPFDTWHPPVSYYSNTRQLFHSFHIAIPIWLTTMLFLQNIKKRSYMGVISLLSLFYCPQTLFAFAVYFFKSIIEDLQLFLKTKQLKGVLKKYFCLENLIILFTVFPIIYLFFASNFTANNNSFFINKPTQIIIESIFWGSGLYLLLISPLFYKKRLFQLTTLILLIFPFFAFKTSYDFLLRVAIPPMIILMILVIKFLYSKTDKYNAIKRALIIAVIIGTFSPIMDIAGVWGAWNYTGVYLYEKDSIVTFNGKITPEDKPTDNIYDYRNYASINYMNYPFWKYIASNNKKSVFKVNKI